MEKNTRVKARVKALALKEIITTKDKVLVMGHANTDVDSFGAAVGIYRIAKTLGRNAHIVLNTTNNTIKPWVDSFKSRLDHEEEAIITNTQAIEMADKDVYKRQACQRCRDSAAGQRKIQGTSRYCGLCGKAG